MVVAPRLHSSDTATIAPNVQIMMFVRVVLMLGLEEKELSRTILLSKSYQLILLNTTSKFTRIKDSKLWLRRNPLVPLKLQRRNPSQMTLAVAEVERSLRSVVHRKNNKIPSRFSCHLDNLFDSNDTFCGLLLSTHFNPQHWLLCHMGLC
jgi:hypothetical protein